MRLNPFRRRSSRRRGYASSGWLKPETKRAVVGVLLILFSVIALLGFFGAAGPTGESIVRGLRVVFGWIGYAVPVGLIALGIHLIRPLMDNMPRLRVVGMLLLLVGLLGTFHLIGVAPEDAYQVALEGRGGGLLGFMLSFPLSRALSNIGSIILFLAAVLIGFFLTFNVSPRDIGRWLAMFVPARQGEEGEEEGIEEEGATTLPTFRVNRMRLGSNKPDPAQLHLDEKQRRQEEEQQQRLKSQLKAANRRYHPPSLDLLHSSTSEPDGGNVEENRRKIKETLKSFDIEVTMGKVSVGPTVTQYTLQPQEGVKLARITALQNDLALALAAHPIRIEAPIPGTSFVGVEIPNKNVSLVRLRDLLASKVFRAAESPLSFAVGKDVAGRAMVATLERMPHLLIAGATGSGKSIFVNTLLMSLLYRNSPALVRLILVDPKRVELSLYNDLPHLLTPVIIESEKTINALRWAVREMDRRYRVLSESGARNLFSFNTNNPEEAMPMIVIVIDELADLMAKHSRDVEGAIVRLSQMARAVGIHLVLATQRPSVNVITGLIKANIPSRIAFNVASQIDSRTILDAAGAEKLLGNGDMLYLSGDRSKPLRLQGSFISEEEVRAVVEDISENNAGEMEFDEAITARETAADVSGGDVGNDDELLGQAKQLVIETGKASASLLQRRLRVGYARAARLLDMLEEAGVIGIQEGNRPREILTQSESRTLEPRDGEEAGEPGTPEDSDFFPSQDRSRW